MSFCIAAATKARVEAAWEKMDKGVSHKTLQDLLKKPSKQPSSTAKKTSHKSSAVRIFSFVTLMKITVVG